MKKINSPEQIRTPKQLTEFYDKILPWLKMADDKQKPLIDWLTNRYEETLFSHNVNGMDFIYPKSYLIALESVAIEIEMADEKA